MFIMWLHFHGFLNKSGKIPFPLELKANPYHLIYIYIYIIISTSKLKEQQHQNPIENLTPNLQLQVSLPTYILLDSKYSVVPLSSSILGIMKENYPFSSKHQSSLKPFFPSAVCLFYKFLLPSIILRGLNVENPPL